MAVRANSQSETRPLWVGAWQALPRLSVIKTAGEKDTPVVTVAWHSIQKSSANEASSEYISLLLESLIEQLQTSGFRQKVVHDEHVPRIKSFC